MGAKTWFQHDCNARKKEQLSNLFSIPIHGAALLGRFWVLQELWLEMQLHKPKPSQTFRVNLHTLCKEWNINLRSLPRILEIFTDVLSIKFRIFEIPKSMTYKAGITNESTFIVESPRYFLESSRYFLETTLPKSLTFINVRSSSLLDIERDRERDVIRILSHLNKTSGKAFKNSEASLRPIAQILESHSVDECEKVIDFIVPLWSQKSDMQLYIRPSTIFGENFESYLEGAKGGANAAGDISKWTPTDPGDNET